MQDRDETGSAASARHPATGGHEKALDDAVAQMLVVGPRIFRTVKAHMMRTLEVPEDIRELGEAQMTVMHLLNKGKHMTSELARIHNVTMPTMTRIVDGLVEKGYVERRHDAEDRRCIFLELTGDGKEIGAYLEKRFREELRRYLSPLSEEQLRDIKRAHQHLASLLGEKNVEDDAGKAENTAGQEKDKSQLASTTN